MSNNKFNFTSDFDAQDFQGGNLDIHVSEIVHDELLANMPVKTNASQILYSTLLSTSDIDNTVNGFVEKGGSTDGKALTLGTLDDNSVIIKQNSFNQMSIANNQIDICACQSQNMTWDLANSSTSKIVLTTPGRIYFDGSHATRMWAHSDITFNPSANDYDFIFNFAEGPTRNPPPNSNQSIGHTAIGFRTTRTTGSSNVNEANIFTGGVVGSLYDFMSVGTPSIYSAAAVDGATRIPVTTSLLKFEIRDQVGKWYLDAGAGYVEQTTASPIVMDQPLYYMAYYDVEFFGCVFDVNVSWSIPGSQLQINDDSVKLKVPLVIPDATTNAFKIIDDSSNDYLKMDTTLNTIGLEQKTLYNAGTGDNTGEIATLNHVDTNYHSQGGSAFGADAVKGTTDNFDVKIVRNNLSQVEYTSDSHTHTIPDAKTTAFEVKDVSANTYIAVDSKDATITLGGLIVPVADNIIDLGRGTNRFKDGYLSGKLQLSDISAPANPGASKGVLYKLTGDDGIWWKPDTGGSAVDLTAAPSDATKVTKNGDTDGSALTIGTNDDFDVNIERKNANVMTFGSAQTNITIPHAITTAMLIHDSVENFLTIDSSNNKTISNQDLQIDGDFRYDKGACEMYVENNATVTSVIDTDGFKKVVYNSADTYVGFDSSSSGGAGFTVDTVTNIGRITYTGARTRRAHCGVTISCTSDTNNVLLDFAIYKNGTTKVAGSEIKMFYANGINKFVSGAIHSMPQLATNDYLELWISTTSTASIDVDVEEVNFFCIGMPNVVV